jgi:hypothetical protein
VSYAGLMDWLMAGECRASSVSAGLMVQAQFLLIVSVLLMVELHCAPCCFMSHGVNQGHMVSHGVTCAVTVCRCIPQTLHVVSAVHAYTCLEPFQ